MTKETSKKDVKDRFLMHAVVGTGVAAGMYIRGNATLLKRVTKSITELITKK